MDEEPPVTLSLILRHRHYTRHIIFLLTMFLFREISDKMAAFAIVFGQYVKQERLDVIIQRLVVQKQFGEEAEILTVYFVRVPVDFEHRYVAAAVYLRGGRMSPQTLVQVTHENRSTLRILKTKFT